MKGHLLLFLTAVTFSSCVKEEDRPIAPALPIPYSFTNSVLYKNKFSEDSSVVFSAPDINIKFYNLQDSSSDKVKVSAISDSNGKFTVQGLFKDSIYFAKISGTINDAKGNKLSYSSQHIFTPGSTKDPFLTEITEQGQNGLIISIADAFGEVISKAQVCIYTSKMIAQLDSNFTGENAILKNSADNTGRLIALNLPVSNVYIKGAVRVNDSTLLKSDIVNIIVEKNRIKPLAIKIF